MCVFKVKNKFNKINKSFFYVIKQNLKKTLSFRVLSFILIYIELKSIKTKTKNNTKSVGICYYVSLKLTKQTDCRYTVYV